MNVAQILALVSTAAQIIPVAEQAISAMIAEGRTSTTDAETAALNAAVSAQASAEAEFVKDENAG